MKAIPNFSHSEESPKIMAVYPPYAAEEVAICRDSELRAFIVHACNISAALVGALENTVSILGSELAGFEKRQARGEVLTKVRTDHLARLSEARAALALAKSP